MLAANALKDTISPVFAVVSPMAAIIASASAPTIPCVASASLIFAAVFKFVATVSSPALPVRIVLIAASFVASPILVEFKIASFTFAPFSASIAAVSPAYVAMLLLIALVNFDHRSGKKNLPSWIPAIVISALCNTPTLSMIFTNPVPTSTRNLTTSDLIKSIHIVWTAFVN